MGVEPTMKFYFDIGPEPTAYTNSAIPPNHSCLWKGKTGYGIEDV